VIVGGLLGAAQLGLVFAEDSAICGSKCEVKDASEHEVDCILYGPSKPLPFCKIILF